MVEDFVRLNSDHLSPAREIVARLRDAIDRSEQVYAITIGGESGSGKSTLSKALGKVLEEKGVNNFILHIDDYFNLPPEDNFRRRKADISRVGPQEVNMKLFQKHIDRVKKGSRYLKKPLVHYRENKIRDVIVELDGIDVVIAEGTYATLLEHIDCKIFMRRNFRQTYGDRAKRGRDPMTSFTEEVLEIEHKILKEHATMADLWVGTDYEIQLRSAHNENTG